MHALKFIDAPKIDRPIETNREHGLDRSKKWNPTQMKANRKWFINLRS